MYSIVKTAQLLTHLFVLCNTGNAYVITVISQIFQTPCPQYFE